MTKHQKKTLHKLLHKYVRLRDGEKCLKCGKKTYLQLSHIYPKGKYRRMAFDHENVKLLCNACHLFWWHKNPLEAAEWLNKTLSKPRLARLKVRSLTAKLPFDYALIKLELEQLIKKYDKK